MTSGRPTTLRLHGDLLLTQTLSEVHLGIRKNPCFDGSTRLVHMPAG